MEDAWYNNLFGTGTNIWGAGGNGNTQKMVDAGLLAPDAKSKAQSQSLMRGLLGAGVSYLSQPQNQNYGSVTPYIGKALQAGMEQAQKPFDNLATTANQNKTLNDLIKAKETETAVQKAKDNLYTTLPGSSYTTRTPQAAINKTGPDGQKAIAPSYGLNSNTVDVPEMKLFNPQALSDLAVTHPEEAAKILANRKTMKEIQTMGQTEAPDRWRPITEDEKVKFGVEHGQINEKTGKFAGTDKNGVRITNDIKMPGEAPKMSKSQEALQDDFVKDYLDLKSTSKDVLDDNASVDTALDLVNNLPRDATGLGSGAKAIWDEALTSIGLQPSFFSVGDLANRQFLESISNRLALGMRKAGSGVMTDKDFEVFKSMVGGLDSTKEANKLILGFRKHINDRKLQIYKAAIKYRQGSTSFNGEFKEPGTLDAGFEDWLLDQREQTYDLTKQWKLNYEGINGKYVDTDDGNTVLIEEIDEIPGQGGNGT